jgi:hypothetical protein
MFRKAEYDPEFAQTVGIARYFGETCWETYLSRGFLILFLSGKKSTVN